MAAQPVNIYGDLPEDVLNIARARVNELVLTPDGDPGGANPGEQFTEIGGGKGLSTHLNPDGSLILRTQVIFNSAWRKFQKYMGNLGYRTLIGDALVLTGLPINANADPGVQTWVSWNGTGLSDGTGFATTPALPERFLAPLKIFERQSGTDAIFFPMGCSLDGLRPQAVRAVLNRQWEWRDNGLYLPGATSVTDLQFRYIRRFSDLPDPQYFVLNTPWYLQRLPIRDCASPLAWYVGHEATFQSDPLIAAQMLANGELEANLLFNDQARADQRTNNRRRPRGGGRSRGWGLI